MTAAIFSIASISPAATEDECPTHSTSVRLERADPLLLPRSVAPPCGSRRRHHPPVIPTGADRYFFLSHSLLRMSRAAQRRNLSLIAQDASRTVRQPLALVPGSALRRLVAFTRVHHVFLLLSFLIHNVKRPAVRRHQLHFHFVKASILRAVSRRVGNTVLMPQHRSHLLEYSRNFAIEMREPRKSPGLISKRF